MPRSRWIAGSATFTTVLSSMIMKRAKQRAPSVHHFRFSSAKILARIRGKLAGTSLTVKAARLGFPGDGRRLEPDPRGARAGERRPADAHARVRRLPGAAALLAGGSGAVLGRGRRGHGARVLAAVGARRGRLAGAGMGYVVRRRQAQPRVELRPSLGGADARRRRGGMGVGGRKTARADVRRALARRDALRRGARRARRRARRPRGVLPADVARGADRLARVRARGGGAGADLLRLRGARGGAAAPPRRGEGGRDRGRLATARARGAHEGGRRRGAAGGALGRARGRVAPA